MSTNPIPGGQDIESTLGHLSKAELLSLIKRMVQLYPDLAGLIETAQQTTPSHKPQRPPFNPEFYRRQVNEIFYTTDRNTWGSEGRAAGPLLRIVDIGNDYVKQQDYVDAATLYEIIIRGILDNYDSFRWHPYEGDLDDVVEECVEGLGRCLRGKQDDAAVRKQIIQTLYDVYDFDSSLENDEPVMSSRVPAMLVRWTTLEERLMIATWVREAFDLEIDWHANDVSDSEDFDDFLLGLEADTIDDETFLRIEKSFSFLLLTLTKCYHLLQIASLERTIDV